MGAGGLAFISTVFFFSFLSKWHGMTLGMGWEGWMGRVGRGKLRTRKKKREEKNEFVG